MAGEPRGPLCGHKLGKHWVDRGTSGRTRNFPPRPVGLSAAEIKRRKRGAALHAQDARALLTAQLPFVLENMTDAQIQQMQMVFDASVIDPELEREAKQYYDRAGVWTDEGSAIWDEAAKRKADRIMAGYIAIDDWDKRIRLDYTKLLDPKALNPVTDNPDEAAYLETIKKTLEKQGIWLQFGAQMVRDPHDPSRRVLDPHNFSVWLTVGPTGDTIPTKTGQLTRDSLLQTSELGAGYYDRVYVGPVQKALEREMTRLDNEISSGRSQHQSQEQIRSQSPIVSAISDRLGGADFPDYSIWDPPFKMLLRAKGLNAGGNVRASRALLVTAAILTRTCAQVLADYIDKTTKGADRAITVLKVAKVAGEIAGVVLMVTGVAGVVRAGVASAAEGGAAATTSEVDVLAKKMVDKAIADNPELADELAQVRWVRGPKGSIGGFVKPNHSYGLSAGGWGKWP